MFSKQILKVLLLTLSVMSIKHDAYTQFSYIPPKPDNVSESEYRRGKLILQNSYDQIKNAKNGIVASDYWNFAMAYLAMGQPKDTIYNLLLKSKAIDPPGFCKIATYAIAQYDGIENVKFYKEIGVEYKQLIESCSSVEIRPTKEVDALTYSKSGGFNYEVVAELDRISKLDQKYRLSDNLDRQRLLDIQNTKDIESIIKKYGYPGRKLVGKKYESVAWAVIQHAELPYQEKYLPLIHKAVLEQQLEEAPFKMLIDRIHWKKTGSQIFGSQAGVDFADDKTIAEIKAKYAIK